jgi:hypothetical protein
MIIVMTERDKRRFWIKVDKKGPNDCWEFCSADHNCYGHRRMWLNKHYEGVHRIAWFLHTGGNQIQDGIEIAHTCDNPSCVNPNHLYTTSKTGNQQDKVRKGRHAIGSRNGAAILLEEDVAEMRKDRLSGMSYVAIGEKYNVSKSTAFNATSPKSSLWRHV